MLKVKEIYNSVNTRFSLWMMSLMYFLMNPSGVLANSGGGVITIDKPEVSDGKVKLGNSSDLDIDSVMSTVMERGQTIIGWTAAFAGMMLLGYGIWRAWQAGQAVQKGDSNGWTSARNVVVGSIVGGLLLAIIGVLISVGINFGNTNIQ